MLGPDGEQTQGLPPFSTQRSGTAPGRGLRCTESQLWKEEVPLGGDQERQLQTVAALGTVSSRLWGAALVLTPLLPSTHLGRLTFQTLGGPEGSTAAPSMEV